MANYLNNNSFVWLKSLSDPALQYLLARDFFSANLYQQELLDLRSNLRQSSYAQILNLKKCQSLDLQPKGLLFKTFKALEVGFTIEESEIYDALKIIMDKTLNVDGGASLDWKPKTTVSCRSGDLLYFLLLAGYQGKEVEALAEWLIHNQRFDGGWLHCPFSSAKAVFRFGLTGKSSDFLKSENDPTKSSCLYATAAALRGLLFYQRQGLITNIELEKTISSACEYFLAKRIFRSSSEPEKIIQPLASWNKDFRLLGYPLFSQYDFLTGLQLVAEAGRFADSRCGEAFNLLMSKQNIDGSFNLEQNSIGMLFYDEKKMVKLRNPWVTLRVLRFLKSAELLDDQNKKN